MFSNNIHRNFEWFEASFTRKLQHIIDESARDSASWIRDLFISILLTILPLAFELMSTITSGSDQSEAWLGIAQKILMGGTILSLFALVIWIFVCIWKYNKLVQKLKGRIVPHTIKGHYSMDESVHYFDNDICNDLILSKYYISLATNELDSAGKEFYFIEALHYYYKSIRIFSIICQSCKTNTLNVLFTSNRAGTDKRIDVVRLINYLALIKSIKIPVDSKCDLSIYKEVLEYNKSFDLIVSNFNSTYATLKKQLTAVAEFAQKNDNLIQISQDVARHVSKIENY